MVTLITVIHVIACLFLVLVVLLQAGKGGGVGIAFGSSTSSAVFGGRGAGSFLERLTAGTAIVFMLTSMTLAWYASQSDSARLQKIAVERASKQKLIDKQAADKKAQDEAAARAHTTLPPSGSAAPATTATGNAPTAVPPSVDPIDRDDKAPAVNGDGKADTKPAPKADAAKPAADQPATK